MIHDSLGLLRSVRSTILRSINDRICRRASSRLRSGCLPSYIVVTPHLVHLAPLAARNHPPGIQPVFVANGIGRPDIAWLAEVSPDVPLVPLRASLGGNPNSLVEHGVVINHLARGYEGIFCVQDADCFVSDTEFWASMRLDPETDYAAGPFLRKGEGERPDFPETFILCLNRDLMEKYRRDYGITAEPSSRPRARARRLLNQAGYPDGKYLETLKDYYDTLQQFWIAARLHGFTCRLVSGEGSSVHHVGGTSYLHRAFENLDHWDYWPLNVHYFHLRLLELPRCAPFRERFRGLLDFHGNSNDLLAAFPAFAEGWRRRESDLIIERTNAASIYGFG
jgi:hypothetical protein